MIYRYTYLVIATNKKSTKYGKIYFGKHKTSDLNDGYIGSGKLLKRYLSKYPNDYYKEIIAFYPSEDELNKAEYNLIHPHLGKSYCLNLKEGGEGGTIPRKFTKKHKQNISKGLKGRNISNEHKKHISEAQKGKPGRCSGIKWTEERKQKWSKLRKGHKTSDETRKKISEANKGHIGYMKGVPSPIKGKHKVWDNKELNKFHYE